MGNIEGNKIGTKARIKMENKPLYKQKERTTLYDSST